MTKLMTLLILIGVVLIGTSIASLMIQPPQPAKTRKITAGRATLQIPLNLPGEPKASGTPASGAVLMGSKDDCDITYDHFSGIYWSGRPIPGTALLPTPAYTAVSEKAGGTRGEVVLGHGKQTPTRAIKLSAEKPCGKMVEETLNVVDLYCSSTKTYYAIVGMQDPFMTRERLAGIAGSLQCP